jgi:pentatricopeptide repeat protein
MAKPDIITYNSVLSAMAKAGHASQAQELLHEMRSTNGSATNATSAGTMVQPDAISYATVMNAWRLSGEKGAASRARILLDHMIQTSHHTTQLTPTAGTFGTVLALYAKEKNASEAHLVLHQMLDTFTETGSPIPEAAHFATVMNAWTKSGQKRVAAEKAQDLLIRMEQLHDSGHAHLKPNQQVCHTDCCCYCLPTAPCIVN